MSRLDYCKHELVGDCYDWKNDNCDMCNIFKAYCEGARMAMSSIVRCKDCKHLCKDGECPLRTWFIHTADDFCSYGERREDGK